MNEKKENDAGETVVSDTVENLEEEAKILQDAARERSADARRMRDISGLPADHKEKPEPDSAGDSEKKTKDPKKDFETPEASDEEKARQVLLQAEGKRIEDCTKEVNEILQRHGCVLEIERKVVIMPRRS